MEEGAIQTLTIREWFTKNLVEKAEIDLRYVIIGYLQEYFGGYELNDETVDTFFPGETQKAMTFKNICQAYLRENHLPDDVDLLFGNTGHSYLRSKTICSQLKTHYVKPLPPFLNHACFNLSENDELFKSVDAAQQGGFEFNNKQYSFLIGVALKNRIEDKPAIHFANASHKAGMTIDFLKKFDNFGSHILTVTYHFISSPNVTKIELEADHLLWKVCDDFIQRITPKTDFK